MPHPDAAQLNASLHSSAQPNSGQLNPGQTPSRSLSRRHFLTTSVGAAAAASAVVAAGAPAIAAPIWTRGDLFTLGIASGDPTANRRDYVSTTITATEATARFRTVPAVTIPNAFVSTDATFVVPRGEAALHRV